MVSCISSTHDFSYLSNTPTNLCKALHCILLCCVVLNCIVLLIYCYVDTIQYNAMHKFVGVLDNPPIFGPKLKQKGASYTRVFMVYMQLLWKSSFLWLFLQYTVLLSSPKFAVVFYCFIQPQAFQRPHTRVPCFYQV